MSHLQSYDPELLNCEDDDVIYQNLIYFRGFNMVHVGEPNPIDTDTQMARQAIYAKESNKTYHFIPSDNNSSFKRKPISVQRIPALYHQHNPNAFTTQPFQQNTHSMKVGVQWFGGKKSNHAIYRTDHCRQPIAQENVAFNEIIKMDEEIKSHGKQVLPDVFNAADINPDTWNPINILRDIAKVIATRNKTLNAVNKKKNNGYVGSYVCFFLHLICLEII